ncbi:hypothetical protein GCM10023350_34210 [Nocardioides endophyticus]|uniref:YncI copper-binding domain-containing protein n=1 Tax=Nocardioides endophyticus TaxID=1353775 RepID=A0ABP8Z4T4_9ACTN
MDREVTTVRRRRTAARLAAAALLPLAVVGLAVPASAHVSITPSSTVAGASAVLDVSIPHGCDGSPTTEVTIRIPEEINAVSPTRNALWELEKETVQLDPPVADSHGNQATERVASVTYRTDTPLPDGHRDVFELALQIPDTAGATLVFPTIQTCEHGEAAWIEVPEDGQDPDELELPAPAFVVTAGSESHQASATTILAAGPTAGSQEGSSAEVPVIAYAAFGLSVLAVMLGVACLARLRRQT